MIEEEKLLFKYQPSVYEGVLEYEELLKTEGVALATAYSALNNIVSLQKLSTLTIDGIQSYEEIFGIIANPSVETEEFRRERIINRLSMKPPFSLEFLYQRLDEIVGRNNWLVTMDYENHTLYIESSARDQQWAGELSITINSIKPANIVYVPVPATFNGLRLNSTLRYSQDTANYVAGFWTVGEKDIVSYEDKGEIKMANQHNMTDQMFEDVLKQLRDAIVVDFIFNDTLVKPATITIDSVNNQLICTCEVLSSDGLNRITHFAVRNSAGQALDLQIVDVPVIDGATFKYTVGVGEGA